MMAMNMAASTDLNSAGTTVELKGSYQVASTVVERGKSRADQMVESMAELLDLLMAARMADWMGLWTAQKLESKKAVMKVDSKALSTASVRDLS